MTKVNLGCGVDYREGWINVDVADYLETDVQIDLDDQPYDQFETNECDVILASHVLEHLENPVGAVQEIVRMLDDGGEFRLVFPIGHTKFQDPTHENYWNYHTPEHFVGEYENDHYSTSELQLTHREISWGLNPHDEQEFERVERKLDRCEHYGWLDQVEGLMGEVTATFEYFAEE